MTLHQTPVTTVKVTTVRLPGGKWQSAESAPAGTETETASHVSEAKANAVERRVHDWRLCDCVKDIDIMQIVPLFLRRTAQERH
jgi:hypothetical protein